MRIGFANGCFDCFHEGHRHFLERAAEQCDYLIVAVNSNESVGVLKGPERPQDLWLVRAGYVAAFADAVIPFDGNPVPLVQSLRPHVLFRGEDQHTFHVERSLIGELILIPRLPGLSTTQILQPHAQS